MSPFDLATKTSLNLTLTFFTVQWIEEIVTVFVYSKNDCACCLVFCYWLVNVSPPFFFLREIILHFVLPHQHTTVYLTIMNLWATVQFSMPASYPHMWISCIYSLMKEKKIMWKHWHLSLHMQDLWLALRRQNIDFYSIKTACKDASS